MINRTASQSLANYSVFEDAMERLEISSSELCRALGYSSGSGSTWKINNKIPKVCAVAIEGLLRRTNCSDKQIILVVKGTKAKEAALISFLDAIGCAHTQI